MAWQFNPFTNKLDKTLSSAELQALLDLYVRIIGDTMTGQLTIDPSAGDTSLDCKKNIILKSGQKLIFDG